ncbi:hypothetical protein CEUSTIGMA_g2440.t1 [Chlamydomonas eustigma]|uniref:Uncharacterized protein n=1 Tax=Chlamydomonas eustigma TaxID=1157962 RepID=A0A250WVX8_9CHLO|nr:hypothetical protein CEUSTIGMA_g2440.t1 [Chlamydomonas eustigma]|eukprot:GAX74994.1 hypothetical protein CEUSTIGMA_g2440.t1 [Chlamydomonas eustigma]
MYLPVSHDGFSQQNREAAKKMLFDVINGDSSNRHDPTAIQKIVELEQKTFEQSSGFSDYQRRISEKVERIIKIKSSKTLHQQVQHHGGSASSGATPFGNQGHPVVGRPALGTASHLSQPLHQLKTQTGQNLMGQTGVPQAGQSILQQPHGNSVQLQYAVQQGGAIPPVSSVSMGLQPQLNFSHQHQQHRQMQAPVSMALQTNGPPAAPALQAQIQQQQYHVAQAAAPAAAWASTGEDDYTEFWDVLAQGPAQGNNQQQQQQPLLELPQPSSAGLRAAAAAQSQILPPTATALSAVGPTQLQPATHPFHALPQQLGASGAVKPPSLPGPSPQPLQLSSAVGLTTLQISNDVHAAQGAVTAAAFPSSQPLVGAKAALPAGMGSAPQFAAAQIGAAAAVRTAGVPTPTLLGAGEGALPPIVPSLPQLEDVDSMPPEKLRDMFWQLVTFMQAKIRPGIQNMLSKLEAMDLNQFGDNQEMQKYQRKKSHLVQIMKLISVQPSDPSVDTGAKAVKQLVYCMKTVTRSSRSQAEEAAATASSLATGLAAAAAAAETPDVMVVEPSHMSTVQIKPSRADNASLQRSSLSAASVPASPILPNPETLQRVLGLLNKGSRQRVLGLLNKGSRQPSSHQGQDAKSGMVGGTRPADPHSISTITRSKGSTQLLAKAVPGDERTVHLQHHVQELALDWLQGDMACPPFPMLQELGQDGVLWKSEVISSKCTSVCRMDGPVKVEPYFLALSPGSPDSQQTAVMQNDRQQAVTEAGERDSRGETSVSDADASCRNTRRRRREEVAQQCEKIELHLTQKRRHLEQGSAIDTALKESHVCLRVLEEGDASFVRAFAWCTESVQVECSVHTAGSKDVSSGKASLEDSSETQGGGSTSVSPFRQSPLVQAGDASTLVWSTMTILIPPGYPASPASAMFSSSAPHYHASIASAARAAFQSEVQLRSRGCSLEEIAVLWQEAVRLVTTPAQKVATPPVPPRM